jgi:predicted Zn-dependent protease
MRQVHTELKVYEDRQLNSSIRIRAKLQQTLGEIQQWRNMELGKIQNLDISVEEKTRRRFDINNGADARSSQIKVSAISQEDALRKLNERADRQLFSVKKDVSSFALKYQK